MGSFINALLDKIYRRCPVQTRFSGVDVINGTCLELDYNYTKNDNVGTR
jgi:hypothetical protein